MALRMANQVRQRLQQKVSLGFMKEKITIKIADTRGSPKTLKPQFIYKNRLEKKKFHPSHLSLHNI